MYQEIVVDFVIAPLPLALQIALSTGQLSNSVEGLSMPAHLSILVSHASYHIRYLSIPPFRIGCPNPLERLLGFALSTYQE